jgi:hypothetical protein
VAEVEVLDETKNHVEPKTLFGQPLSEVFAKLKLGNTVHDKANSYVAQVRAYLIKIGSTFLMVDETNIDDAIARTKKRYGSRSHLKVVLVGVRFYQGFDDQKNPTRPWETQTATGAVLSWFYKPGELVPITEIVKYESVNRGDLVLFPKCHGLVIKKKLLNKPQFYLTSSWSCYSITLLNHMGDGFTRFLPDRQFSVHYRQSLEEDSEGADT